MAQHKEEYFIIPMLKVLYFKSGPMSTEDIKKNIFKYCELSDEDMLPYPSRNKKEPRYYQIVGNIISHKNANFFKYVYKAPNPSSDKVELYALNGDGLEFIKRIVEEESEILDDSFVDDKDILVNETEYVEIEDIHKRTLGIYDKTGEIKKPIADKGLSKIVLELTGYKCQIAVMLDETHELFLNKQGEPYLETHHLIPLKASKDFFPLNLDIAPNLVPLCPSCHAKLHHGSFEEKNAILRMLYDKRIKALNENGIYISFEELIEKYYI